MSSGVTAARTDEGPNPHLNGVKVKPSPLTTDSSISSPNSSIPTFLSSPITPTSPTITRKPIKQRATSQSIGGSSSASQTSSTSNITSRYRSASANPREFSRITAPRKALGQSTSRQRSNPSLQDIIKKFNDQPDEALPLPPARSESRSSSRCASPVRPGSALATHSKRHLPSAKSTTSKPPSSRSATATPTKLPASGKASGDRRNSTSSTGSQQARGRRTSVKSVTELTRATTPSSVESETAPTKRTSIPKAAARTSAGTHSTPPISPISPVDPTRKSRLPQSSSSRAPAGSINTPGSRSSLPKPISTKTSSATDKKPTSEKSPSLNAFINAPESQKSPPLRSSRPRLPVASAKNVSSTRPGMTDSSISSSKAAARSTRKVPPSTKEEAKPKKKIPELGTVDFAARRKMIASAFNERMDKEREERNRAYQKKEREAAAKKKQEELEAKKAIDPATAEQSQHPNDDEPESELQPSTELESKPIGLGLDFGNETTSPPEYREEEVEEHLNEPISKRNTEEFVNSTATTCEIDETTRNVPHTERKNSTQIPATESSQRPLSVIEGPPSSPGLPKKPDEYKRWSASLSATAEPYVLMDGSMLVGGVGRPPSRQFSDDLISPSTEPMSRVLAEFPVETSPVTPTILVADSPNIDEGIPDARRDTLLFRRPLSPIQGSPSGKNGDWEKAVEDEKRRRREIEQDREMKLKNRLSTPVTPKMGSPILDNDATPPGRAVSHKKQSSWSASPHLAPPDSIGHIMWKYRPLSTSGESMIDTFYKEQEELSLSRRRKQELMRFLESEEPQDEVDPPDTKGKTTKKYELSDKEYMLDVRGDDQQAGGYVEIEGTYRYSASTVNSSVRSRSVDPNDYWTPQPSIGEFETQPRESWATDSTMTSYSTSSGLAPNGTFSRKIMDRERPTSDTPPTPPPKDFVFSPKKAPSTQSLRSDVMPPPPPKTIAARRASISNDVVEPLRIVKPPFLQKDVYDSPVSLKSTNSINVESHDEHHDHSGSSEYSEEESSERSSNAADSTPMLYSAASPNPSTITTTGSFATIPDVAAEKKLLTKRRFLLKELLDTEKTFFQDMTVTEEIYRGTADACDDLKSEDIRVLFGNTNAIVAFSRLFLETLKTAIAPVYILAKAQRTPSGSQVDINEMNHGDTELGEVSEEADMKTWVGVAFTEVIINMEKIYGDYCKNHEKAVSRLQQLEKNRGVAIWLKECKHVADDLTNAWSLESLLIKPVQRLLKYPLLLDQILDCTSMNHPDREAIELVAKEIRFVTERINQSKKRKDVMEKVVWRTKGDVDVRHGLTKRFQRRAERLRQSVGLSEMPHDEVYEQTIAKFKEQYFKLQLVSKDIEMYLNDVEKQISDFGIIAVRFEEFAACSPTRFKEYEERWQTFTKRTKEMKEVILVDHRIRVKRHVIAPLETALKMCDNPQKVMLKREKKKVDFARVRAMKEKGEKVDRKSNELADAYDTINETLKDELPRLHALIEKLVAAALLNFMELCGSWEKSWRGLLEGLLDPLDIPSNFSDIVEVYKSDFNKVESVVDSLTITNTNSSIWQNVGISRLDSASSSSLSLYRSSTADGNGSSPNPSIYSRSSINGSSTPKRHSGSFTGSALIAASISPALPILPTGILSSPSIQRGRASSAVYTPPTRAPPPPPVRALSTANVPTQSPKLSPTSSTHSGISGNSIAQTSYPIMPPIPGLDTNSPSPSRPSTSSDNTGKTVLGYPVLWLCASIYSYQASKEADAKRDMGFAYLTYDQGEIFDVIGSKGEYWLAKNQDDSGQEFGWIWSKHFAKLALD